MSRQSYVEHMFHKNVAPKFTGLDYYPNNEIENDKYGVEVTVYRDGRTLIKSYKRETWHLDDYDLFTRYRVYVDGNLVYEEDE